MRKCDCIVRYPLLTLTLRSNSLYRVAYVMSRPMTRSECGALEHLAVSERCHAVILAVIRGGNRHG